jgi:fucose 4-O-acetylase-like acetyltransferase
MPLLLKDKDDNNKHGRVFWIDYAKVFAIYLVILGHLQLDIRFLVDAIYSFHMPLFFFISGILHKNECIGVVVKKNIKRLIIPYSFFYLISWIWWLYFSYIRNANGLFPSEISFYECVYKPFKSFILGGMVPNSYSVNVVFWFIIALFQMKIWFSLFNHVHRVIKITLLLSLPMLYYFVVKNGIETYYSIGNTIQWFVFFLIGYHWKAYFLSASNRTSDKSLLFTFVLSLLVFIGVVFYSSQFELHQPLFIFCKKILTAIPGILMTCSGAFLLKKSYRLIQYISENTFIIMCIHLLILGFLCGFMKIYFHIDTQSFPSLLAFICSFIILFLSLIASEFFNKYFPYWVGKRDK